jgi:eukaryotic-like serine/threonine-protein kinase
MHPYPHPDRLAAGTAVGRFVVARLLGTGGMGEVYLAHDSQLNRTVALKLVSTRTGADPESQLRFIAEARNAASLRHPNIVSIYEIGQYQGRPFIAMEYLSGGSVADLIRNGPVDQGVALSIARQVCLGLQAAHAAGIVHRDISPSNIMFDADGVVRIVDFGVAQSGLSPHADAPAQMGTVSYMSPEQARGEPALPASDLFSLGAVMYELLTGVRLFSGEYEASILYAIQNQLVLPPSAARPDIPTRLDALILKLLCKNPSDRFRSASDLLIALDEPVRTGRARTDSKRRAALGFKIALPLLLVAAISILMFFNRHRILPVLRSDSGRHAVAVLPFDNLGAPDDDYFADGMTDAVINALARSGDITTISRTSSARYRKTQKTARQIANDLDVDFLVAGTVFWDKSGPGGKVRVNASLVRASDDAQIWANSYERSLDHIFVVQAEIANDVGRALRIRVTALTKPSLQSADPRAYDLYLRGNDCFNRGWERSDLTNAEIMYRRSIGYDTAFPLSYAMLSRCNSSLYWEYFDRSSERCTAARQFAEKALLLGPDLAEPHWALGYYYYHCELDYPHALTEFRTALAMEPGNADLLNAIAAVERRQGLLVDAADHFQRALQLDPRSHLKALDVALTFGMMRQFRKAAQFSEQAIVLAPDWNLPYLYRAWLTVLENGNVATADSILNSAPPDARLDQSKYFWWLKRLTTTDLKTALNMLKPFEDTAAYYLYRAQLERIAGNTKASRLAADSARIFLLPSISGATIAPRIYSSLGLAYAYLGNKELAQQNGQKAVELLPASRDAFDAPFLLINLAEIYVVVGDYEKGVGQLAYLKSLPGFVSSHYLKADPLWKPLQSVPAFVRLVDSTEN